MNKITPHLLRDLHTSLPEGTECYLSSTARKALLKYRKGMEPSAFINKDTAMSLLGQRLGRGLKRFLLKDIRSALPAHHACQPERMA
ncbi:hypothetical protein IVG45_01000 [Methylomonas sp. LL1]|uniref:hypothetical protein n=1 Tax=Methylomonas sp. LL1 TaxID=2785785 RepID=UPI0018C40CDC|nr:hypothetical protein [Methylomonas sp. LL1]QPK63594.1 hypothetical protein IVG45_01000 [Methylomonas sp. LL1]